MVILFLADGFEEIEALTQVDYLRRAGVDVTTVGVNGEFAVGTRNITVKCDKILADVEFTDEIEMVILPGGLGGMNAMKQNEKVCDIVKRANSAGKYIAAICASPTIFAYLGLLKGKNCICYPGMEDELVSGGGIVKDARVVTDGNIVTAKAAGASEEFSFELIRLLCSQDVSDKVKNSICAR